MIAPEQLSAVWQGVSTSSRKDATQWSNTCLIFTPVTLESKLVYEIKGRGVSFWRNMAIDFNIFGMLDPSTNSFTLCKQHEGKYTNQVKYSGTLASGYSAASPGELLYSMAGSYDNGNIELTQISNSPSKVVECLLSACWFGKSISRTNDVTNWSNVNLDFRVRKECLEMKNGNNLLLVIEGDGVSIWKDMRISFDLRGEVDLIDGRVWLEKEHKGQYTNVVRYNGVLELDKVKIAGWYNNGTIELVSGVDDDSRVFTGGLLKQAVKAVLARRGEEGGEGEGEGEGGGEGGRGEEAAEEVSKMFDNNFEIEKIDFEEEEEGEEEEKDEEDKNEEDEDEDEEDDVPAAEAEVEGGVEEQDEDEEKDICKICFVNTINCIAIPCGHFSNCLDCGRRLTKCPICRIKVDKMQEVFRA